MMCHYSDNLNKIVCNFLLLLLYWTVTVQVGRSLELRRVLNISKYTSALHSQYLTLYMLKSWQCVNCPNNPFLDSEEIFTVQVGIWGRVTIIFLPNLRMLFLWYYCNLWSIYFKCGKIYYKVLLNQVKSRHCGIIQLIWVVDWNFYLKSKYPWLIGHFKR